VAGSVVWTPCPARASLAGERGPDAEGGATAGFDVREFQLVLLRRMADYQPERVDAARERLSATIDEMRDANRHWQALSRAPGAPRGLRRLRLALGVPEHEDTRVYGDLTFRVARWSLPLWPDLTFEAVAGHDGELWHQWLVRADGVPTPPLRTVDDLAPWSCVVGDLEQHFDVAGRAADGPSRWAVRFAADDAHAARRHVTARFVWGLLQDVTVEPRTT